MLTLVPEEIERYAAAHSEPLSPLMAELVAETNEVMGERARMLSGQVEGALLQTLIGALGATRVLEVGMFTGFSALMMAAALPEDGRLTTCEINDKAIAFAERYFARHPAGGKIEIMRGPAIDTLKTLKPGYDLVFIDADKVNYTAYYELAIDLLSPNGVIAVDNVLWSGNALDPKDEDGRAIAAFNDHVRNDERVRNVMLTVRDGLSLIRRR
jgi:caffeoyl-CoA O-methyltransferase